jgi:hypothetical protein
MTGYAKGFQPLMWSVFALLVLSGLPLVPAAFEDRLGWESPVRLPPGWRTGISGAHAVAAYGTLLVIGALLVVHVRIGLRRRLNRWTGFLGLGAFAVLAASAMVLYYVADETLARYASLLHLSFALILFVGLALHVVAGRKLHRDRTRPRI